MKTITINLWCPKIESAVEKLHAAGVTSAEFVPPWNPKGTAWALRVRARDLGWPAGQRTDQLYFNVGWVIGIIGVSKDAIVDFTNEDED